MLRDQDRIIAAFPEVESVFGKAGRAETATDPAQLEMIETVITLRPRDEWPLVEPSAGGAAAPDWLAPALRWSGPIDAPRTIEELARDISAATATPGYQMAVAPPIRTRIDMLTTGVRTPVGIKVFGDDLAEIERISVELERHAPRRARDAQHVRGAPDAGASTSTSLPTARRSLATASRSARSTTWSRPRSAACRCRRSSTGARATR